MADQRNITFGMQFSSLDKAVTQMKDLQGTIEDTKEDMVTLEQESDEVGTRIKAGIGVAAMVSVGWVLRQEGQELISEMVSTMPGPDFAKWALKHPAWEMLLQAAQEKH